MAYVKDLDRKCRGNDNTCPRRATHEVFNNRNASHGKFCKRHAEALVKELSKYEAEERVRQGNA